jgi:hypothetical protein
VRDSKAERNAGGTKIGSRFHERTNTLRLLGLILRGLRLEVSVWISKTKGKGVWFSIRFSSLLLYRNCKRLREFEEIEILSKAVEVTVNNKEENC